MTNIYGPSNISIQTGKEERKKSEKETQLVEEIKHTLLEQDLGYQTDNKKNEVNVIFNIGSIKYIIKKVKENVRGVIVTNDKGEVTSFTKKKDIIAALTKLKQILLPNKD